MTGERLQKALARAGLGSRRSCDELIEAGRVRVNGAVAQLGSRVEADDEIEVDGVRVSTDTTDVYVALHKPLDVVTTARDPQGRRTVMDFVPTDPRVFPIGRLDRDTSGLLLLTNDGTFANEVAHPRFGVPKTYLAEVTGSVGSKVLTRIRDGITLDDGPVVVERVGVVGATAGRSLLEVVVGEGRNRLVRRLVAAVGLELRSLSRTAVGDVRLAGLAPGVWRNLDAWEVHALRWRAAGMGGAATSGP